ncbi:LPS export ABC transporter periplasmic protein LptC [Sinimarinibacterium sp. NLF-5-8]|uniref:LPS export ABC transporter periplasmic protein LptC n=1 Tax=Sinimarinibacterium sp. NLF-5-8 TaxID=2698684 RepID=UPI00137BBF0B|nr:LPS export ABC transporter periplasmic protein LptC [Sinimarinibacterium sp. NLF-5-8]QHS11131.1 LPS export ABC transporter periplasmic protein LptC [Sinimarinibacterium sp. NLF-5-8]
MSAAATAPGKARGNGWFVLGVALAGLAAYVSFDSFTPAPQTASSASAVERPRYRLEGATWQRFDEDGTALFTARARSIDYFDDASMQLLAVDVQTHAPQGQWQLQAERGRVPAHQTRIRLEPQAQISGRSARLASLTMQTPALWMDWQTRQIFTDEPIRARAPGWALDARGLRADWSAQKVEFLHDVDVRHAPG